MRKKTRLKVRNSGSVAAEVLLLSVVWAMLLPLPSTILLISGMVILLQELSDQNVGNLKMNERIAGLNPNSIGIWGEVCVKPTC